MNIVTQAILEKLKNPEIREFIEQWDRLEDLVIRVYREASISADDEAEYLRLRTWLEKSYERWKNALRMYWVDLRVGGEPIQHDPFEFILSFRFASDLINDWNVMQHLPAAREALNQYLIDLIAKV